MQLFKIQIEMMMAGLSPAITHAEYDDSVSKFLRRNRIWALGIIVCVVLSIFGIWGLGQFFFGNFVENFPWVMIGFKTIIALLVLRMGISWTAREMILPLNWLKKVHPGTFREKYTNPKLRGANPTYFKTAVMLTKEFWNMVGSKDLLTHLKNSSKYFAMEGQVNNPSGSQNQKVQAQKRQTVHLESSATSPTRFNMDTPQKPLTLSQSNQAMPGWVKFMVVAAGISMVIIVASFVLNYLKEIALEVFLVLGVVLLICIPLGVLVNSVKKIRLGGSLKFALTTIFILTGLAITSVLSVAGVALVNKKAGAFIYEKIAALSGGSVDLSRAQMSSMSYDSASLGSSGQKDTGFALDLTVTETPTPTSTPTNSPEPSSSPTSVPTLTRKIAPNYNITTMEQAKASYTSEIQAYVINANTLVVAYNDIAEQIKAEDADLATWYNIYWGIGNKEGQIGPAQSSIENRQYLEEDIVKIDGVVESFLKRIQTLAKDPLKPLEQPVATKLEMQGRLLDEWYKQADNLGSSLIGTESNYNEDPAKIDKEATRKAFEDAYRAEMQMNNIADEINKGFSGNDATLMKLAAPDGSSFSKWLELQFNPDKEVVKMTQTPGPTIENIVPKILPPTNTPMPTPTMDPCVSASSLAKDRTFYSRKTSLDFYESEFNKAPMAYIEGYVNACNGWVFSWGQDINGDGNLDWAIVDTIEQTTGLGQNGFLPKDRQGFNVLQQADPSSILNATMLTIVETGEYIRKEWPVTQVTLTAIVEQCTPAYPADQQLQISDWRDIKQLEIKPEGLNYVYYVKCGPTYLYVISRAGFKKDGWFVQNATPDGIKKNEPFWVNENGAYLLTGGN